MPRALYTSSHLILTRTLLSHVIDENLRHRRVRKLPQGHRAGRQGVRTQLSWASVFPSLEKNGERRESCSMHPPAPCNQIFWNLEHKHTICISVC